MTKREFVLDYALLGDALMEQGRLTEAATAYQKMIDLKPFYQSYTRAAHLRWLTGDLNGAIDLIHKAIDAASPRNPEALAWAYTRLAGYELQRGNVDQSMRAIDAALTVQPDYAAALLMRGRALLVLERSGDGGNRARARGDASIRCRSISGSWPMPSGAKNATRKRLPSSSNCWRADLRPIPGQLPSSSRRVVTIRNTRSSYPNAS